jgi:hypothetical protein
VQCPHCRAAVAVPVAPAAAAPPAPPSGRPLLDAQTRGMVSVIISILALTFVIGRVKSCQEEAEKNRPSMGEMMKKARDKNR